MTARVRIPLGVHTLEPGRGGVGSAADGYSCQVLAGRHPDIIRSDHPVTQRRLSSAKIGAVTGHLRERNGGYEIRVFLGLDPMTGKRRYATRTVRGGKREAERALAALVVDIESGKTTRTASTVGALLEAWLEAVAANFSPKTARETRGYTDRQLLPDLESLPLRRLRSADLDRYYARLSANRGKHRRPPGLFGVTLGRHETRRDNHRTCREQLPAACHHGPTVGALHAEPFSVKERTRPVAGSRGVTQPLTRSPSRPGAPRRVPPHRPARAPRLPNPGAGITSTSDMRPVVTVPVLSNTMVSTRRVDSRISGPLITMPIWAPRPVPTRSAVGVASPNAHRQAMIRTLTAAVNAA